MRKVFSLIIISVVCLALITSCSKKEDIPEGTIDEFYFVKNEGAVLPVRVAGKETSGNYIIVTHGGPGNTAQTMRNSIGLHDLEKNFKVVYWDQRASGVSQGNIPAEEISIEQFSRDLDAIIEFAKQVKGATNVYLLGHSWGGGLSTYYLANPDNGAAHQAKLKGFILDAGGYNVIGGMQLSMQYVMNYANTSIANNKDRNYWKGYQDYVSQNPKITKDNFLDHAEYVKKAKGIFYGSYELYNSSLPDYEFDAFLKNFNYVNANMKIGGQSIFDAMDLTPWLGNITLPTLVIWGNKDGLLPVGLADPFYNGIATPNADKTKKIYADCAHEPQTEEPVLFQTDVTKFILDHQ